jgi:hypothetical protein
MVNKNTYLITGMLLILQGILIGVLFYNKYPCNLSCIGCNSIYELLSDSWSSIYMTISFFVGIILIVEWRLNLC